MLNISPTPWSIKLTERSILAVPRSVLDSNGTEIVQMRGTPGRAAHLEADAALIAAAPAMLAAVEAASKELAQAVDALAGGSAERASLHMDMARAALMEAHNSATRTVP